MTTTAELNGYDHGADVAEESATASPRPEVSDLAAEQAVLGGMILSPDALADCLELLRTSDFYRPAHKIIFDVISDMADEGLPVDPQTLRIRLDANANRLKYGGAPYLITLIEAVPSAANASFYAQQVRDLAGRRDLAHAANQINGYARNPEMDAAERADQAGRAVDQAVTRDSGPSAVPIGDLLPGFLQNLENGDQDEPAITTGWSDLDHLIPGFRPGELIVIGARPAVGKTSVMLGIAGRAAVREHRPVLMYSLEMSEKEILQRLMSAAARVPLERIRTPQNLTDDDWERMKGAYNRLGSAPLRFSANPYPKMHDIRSDLRAMRRQGEAAELFVLDYLQLMTAPDKTENRQLEIASLARNLKLVAKEFAVPVIVGSQLNRGPEQRMDRRPLLADLRESGAVEQDSDVVILLYRDDLYNPESKDAGTIELHVAKHRNGPTGVVKLAFRGPFAEVANAYLHTIDD